MKTLFILGAGSSDIRYYGIGSKLREHIVTDLVTHTKEIVENKKLPDDFLWSSKEQLYKECEDFTHRFDKADEETTIDVFLRRWRKQFEKVGKFAVALNILNGEWRHMQGSSIIETEYNDFWQPIVFRRIFEPYKRESIMDISQLPVEFLTFNYDRYHEYMFRHYVDNEFLDHPIHQVDKLLYIRHVYGRIRGECELLGFGEYGKKYCLPEVLRTTQHLSLMYEKRGKLEQERLMRFFWEKGGFERVFFLGFQYDPDNLQYIGIPDLMEQSRSVEIYGTTYGMKPWQTSKVKVTLERISSKLVLENCRCSELVENYFHL